MSTHGHSAGRQLGVDRYRAVRRLVRYGRELIEEYNEAHSVWGTDLSGGCGFGAGLLLWLMRRAGHTNVYVVSNLDHCWVEWTVLTESDGTITYVLDVTGSQFDMPKTQLREKKRLWHGAYHWDWGMRKEYRPQQSWTRFANWLRRRGWRESHIFTPDKVADFRSAKP